VIGNEEATEQTKNFLNGNEVATEQAGAKLAAIQ